MAAETGDNACVPGAIIPVLTLGDSGLGARGGADGGDDHPRRPARPDDHDRGRRTFVYDVVAMMLFATLGILLYGLTLTRPLIRVLTVPKRDHPADHLRAVRRRRLRDHLAPVRRLGDAGLRRRRLPAAPRGYPIAPLVLGIVLGDLMEKGLRRGLVLSDGSLTPSSRGRSRWPSRS